MSAELALIQQLKNRNIPKEINNVHSAGGSAQLFNVVQFSAKPALSGALTATTLKTIIDVTGERGSLRQCWLVTNDTTSRTITLKITIDGTVVFNATSSAITTAGTGIVAVGDFTFVNTSTGAVVVGDSPVYFNDSLKIEIASSLSETDKLSLLYSYNLEN